jgi:NitT/TauT family transport system ATP-binding protein
VVLLDEPFSALDFQTKLLLQKEVQSIIRERGKSAILVTHDIGEAIVMADRVLVLRPPPGPRQVGAPDRAARRGA